VVAIAIAAAPFWTSGDALVPADKRPVN
jgi:hypothetical protein